MLSSTEYDTIALYSNELLLLIKSVCLETVLAGCSVTEAASQDDSGSSQKATGSGPGPGPGGSKSESDRERNYYEINNDFLDNA